MVRVVGLSGLIGSGKSYLISFLENNDKFRIIRLGKYLREKYNVNSTDDLINKSQQIKKILISGSIIELFQQQIEESIQNNKIVIIDSIRTKEDVLYLRNYLNYDYKIIFVLANFHLRKKRVTTRCRKGDPLTDRDFQEINENEIKDVMNVIFLEATDYYINNSDQKVSDFEGYIYEILNK